MKHLKRFKYLLGLMVLVTFVACGDSWIETYDPELDEPYGISLLPEILRTSYPDADYTDLPRNWTVDGISSTDSTLYVAVGNGMLYTPSEATALATFVEEGGEAFIATKEISNKFLKYVFTDSCLVNSMYLPSNRLDTLERVKSAHGNSFMMPVIRKNKGKKGSGDYIESRDLCYLPAEHLLILERDSLGHEFFHEDDLIASLMTRYEYGEGHLTILSYPMLLTNVFATDSLGRIAMEEVLRLLPQGIDHIAFDRQRRSPEYAVMQDNLPKSEGFDDESNILKHVLARPPLAAAWYLLLLGAIVFLVFGAKRKQRLIPIVQPRRNTTHEHLGNISRLYLTQPNNSLMASKQFALFEAYCNRRFGLLPLQNDADYERFSKMAGVNPQHLETLKRYQTSIARNQTISNTGFVSIVRILQVIYKGIGRRFD